MFNDNTCQEILCFKSLLRIMHESSFLPYMLMYKVRPKELPSGESKYHSKMPEIIERNTESSSKILVWGATNNGIPPERHIHFPVEFLSDLFFIGLNENCDIKNSTDGIYKVDNNRRWSTVSEDNTNQNQIDESRDEPSDLTKSQRMEIGQRIKPSEVPWYSFLPWFSSDNHTLDSKKKS